MNKQTDFEEFKKILFGLSEMFQRDLKPTTYVMYFAALSDLSIDQINIAANKWVRSGKFFPKPVELRELAIENNQKLTGDAWAEVSEQISLTCGTGKQPVYTSPAIERAVQAVGGLNTIWMAGIENEHVYRAHFNRYYEAISEKEFQNELLGLPNKAEAKLLLEKVRVGINKREQKANAVSLLQ